MKKDLLSLLDLSGEEMLKLIGRGIELKRLKAEGALPQPLKGQVWALMFEKASMRTRVSFETGVALLGGISTIFLTREHVGPGSREPLEDMGRVLSRYVDGLVLRTFAHATQETLAEWSDIPVINGLSDLNHPCQIMADLMTITEHRGSLDGLKAAWIGDGNNMAYSWIAAAIRLGFGLKLICPGGYAPGEEIMALAAAEGADVEVTTDPRAGVAGAEALNTDVWASMGQEAEAEERKGIFAPYQLNMDLVRAAAPGALVLHCLPAHRGEEITAEVLESDQSVVFDQAENRLWAQMAIMEALAH